VSKVTVLRLTGYFCRDAFEDVVDRVQDGHGSVGDTNIGCRWWPSSFGRCFGRAGAGASLAVEAGLRAISTSWMARWQGGVELITTLDS
jgi:hypothetical protein